MSRVLIAGLADGLAGWLARRLNGITVEVAWSTEDVFRQVRAGGCSLLLLDDAFDGASAEQVLRRLRADPAAAEVPVIVAVDPENGDAARRLPALVDELRIDRVLLHPLDRGELARAAAAVVAQRTTAPRPAAPAPAAPPPAAPPPGAPAAIAADATRAEVAAALAGVWERAKPEALARLEALERAVVATVDGRLDGAMRAEAEAEAHRLSGALGTFGSGEGTRLARQIEAAFAGGAPLTRVDGARLARLAATLRAEVEALGTAPAAASTADAPQPSAAEPRRDPRPLLLAIGLDGPAARALETEAAARSMRVRAAGDGARAWVAAGVERPDAVLLDAGIAGDPDALLQAVAAEMPGVPVLLLSGRGTLPDRVRLLQLGARTFLARTAPAAEVLDAAARLLPTEREPRRVLAVDDDPAVLSALRTLLEPQRLEVHTLADPLRFWSALEEVRPHLLVLDVDMPRLSGIELCRVVRADARWSRLPVLFLTAHTDRNTLLRVFAAGADDYVTKPMVGPELSARVFARLERSAG